MSDKELDDLFREAAEGYKIQEDQAAWNDMASRLDKIGEATSWSWKAISSLALIGLTGLTVLWYSESGSNNRAQRLTNEESISNESKSLAPNAENSAAAAASVENTSSQSENLKSESGSQDVTVTGSDKIKEGNTQIAKAVLQNKSGTEDFSADPQNYKTRNNHSEKEPSVVSMENNKQNESTSVALISTSSVFNNTKEENLILNQSDAEKVMLTDSLTIDSTMAAVIPLPKNDTASSKPESLEKPGSFRRISLKLALSPDFSSIKYFTPDKSGINFGILLGYNFNDRWSLVSGAISSRKIYSSTEVTEAYTTPKGYDYPIVKLTGDCRVLDIPLNVYYTFYRHKSLSLKAGLGVSSYLMFSEDYTYYVDNPYGSDMYSQSIDHENNEWFKMANISVTIQKRLSERFYLEFEPFLKTPLSGIGEGNVSLVSMGAFFNLRYDIF